MSEKCGRTLIEVEKAHFSCDLCGLSPAIDARYEGLDFRGIVPCEIDKICSLCLGLPVLHRGVWVRGEWRFIKMERPWL